MFENLFTTLKNKTNTLTDNLKTKSRKLAFNFNFAKNKNVKTTSNYYTVSPVDENEYDHDSYLSPRAISMNYNSAWPSITENMNWNPYVPPSLDEHNIVDRFIKVITIDDEVRLSENV